MNTIRDAFHDAGESWRSAIGALIVGLLIAAALVAYVFLFAGASS